MGEVTEINAENQNSPALRGWNEAMIVTAFNGLYGTTIYNAKAAGYRAEAIQALNALCRSLDMEELQRQD